MESSVIAPPESYDSAGGLGVSIRFSTAAGDAMNSAVPPASSSGVACSDSYACGWRCGRLDLSIPYQLLPNNLYLGADQLKLDTYSSTEVCHDELKLDEEALVYGCRCGWRLLSFPTAR